ncbi:MAG: YjjI family glycine radical enzyme [Acidimicrobiia bacterium]|nr:YjjI family glycine radical enzyme [Acidimicrobiia bacterium]
MNMEEFRSRARDIVNDATLTFHQRRHYLAWLAENALEYPELSKEAAEALNKQIICDLFEGSAPYRGRYILPDYGRALRNGSEHLELEPPQDLDEALNFLLIMYTQVPSITGYPVYLGDFDKILEPYVDDVDDEALYKKLKLFWIALDRILPDAFVHTNLGPRDSRISRTIFRIEREALQVVPNISLKVDPDLTPDDLILDAVQTVFATGKPHFVNHPLMVRDLGEDYAAVSCYNSLKIGGGSHTLNRLNLKEVALLHQGDIDSFIHDTLPHYVELNAELIEARIRYLVEEAKFFEHDFLAVEGLIRLDRFSAMYGIYGMAEAVDLLLEAAGKPGRYGHDDAANELSYQITKKIADLVAARPMPYCDGNNGRAFLHSQSGIDSDLEVTAGTRIPIGDEPEMFDHIKAVAPHHDLFQAGVSDIFHVEDTVRRNPSAMVDIIRGAFREGMRDFTFNLATNGFIRITGYLVRKCDVDQFDEMGARHGSTTFAAGSVKNSHVTERNVKRVLSRESSPRAPQ